jgi:hypothetical protein
MAIEISRTATVRDFAAVGRKEYVSFGCVNPGGSLVRCHRRLHPRSGEGAVGERMVRLRNWMMRCTFLGHLGRLGVDCSSVRSGNNFEVRR